MTTIRDVAEAACVSTATVSHVLNGSRFVLPETRERVEEAIRTLNYRPHGVARSLRRSRTATIGVMISDIANPFFADLVLGVEDVVHRDAGNYNFILCNTEENSQKERMYLEVLSQKRIDGLILASAGGNMKAIQDLLAEGLPIVCVDRDVEGIEADTIVIDNQAAALSLVRHLIAVGHRRIAVLRARLTANSIDDRVAGYRLALAEAGLAANSHDEAESASNVDDACRAAHSLLTSPSRPGAIFCTNNFMTLGAVRAVTELGLHCPEDVAVAGIDDLPWTSGFRPRLTVIAQPARAIGREAATLLLDRIAKRRVSRPGRLVLPFELHVRESCGAALARVSEKGRHTLVKIAGRQHEAGSSSQTSA
ncbi:MAG TPA: LacI family DNA-binding transcriptional regulator [Roseiarcus sp.]|nr:LacI family DNA-binding transcriptional regulator [Roseiarcus sp.]